MCCFKLTIHTLRLSVGGQTDGRTDGRTDARTENIYSIFRDKLLLLGEHGYYTSDFMVVIVLTSREDCLSSAKVYPVVGKCPDPLTIGFSCQLIIDSPLSK
jgi:hypothetical protein